MTSGELLQYRKGLCIAGDYGTPVSGSSHFGLTLPVGGVSRHATNVIANNSSGWRARAHRVSFVVTEDAYQFWQCESRTVFLHRENVVCWKRGPQLYFVRWLFEAVYSDRSPVNVDHPGK